MTPGYRGITRETGSQPGERDRIQDQVFKSAKEGRKFERHQKVNSRNIACNAHRHDGPEGREKKKAGGQFSLCRRQR